MIRAQQGPAGSCGATLYQSHSYPSRVHKDRETGLSPCLRRTCTPTICPSHSVPWLLLPQLALHSRKLRLLANFLEIWVNERHSRKVKYFTREEPGIRPSVCLRPCLLLDCHPPSKLLEPATWPSCCFWQHPSCRCPPDKVGPDSVSVLLSSSCAPHLSMSHQPPFLPSV